MDTIREGFRHVHRNWQLIVVQFVMGVINLVAALFFIGLPLVIGLLVLGQDASELRRMGELFQSSSGLFDIIARYMGLVLVFLLSLLFYMLFAFALWIYVLGGAAGSLGKSIREARYVFSMGTFMSEGRRLFWPLAVYVTVVSLLLLGVIVALGVAGGLTAALFGGLGLGDSRLGVFLKVFFVLSFIAAGGLALTGLLVVSLQGLAELVLRGSRPVRSLVNGFNYLEKNSRALYLAGIVVAGYVAAQFVLAGVGYPLQLVPLVGPLLSIPYQLVSSLVQGYLCLALLATVFVDYQPPAFGLPPGLAPAPAQGAIGGSSTPGSGTSPEGVSPHGTPPPA
jgi:hypothetical protein